MAGNLGGEFGGGRPLPLDFNKWRVTRKRDDVNKEFNGCQTNGTTTVLYLDIPS